MQPALWWGRAVLYEDRLELRGWSLRGRYRRVIALTQIQHIDVLASNGIGLWCTSGETLRLRLDNAIRWKQRVLRQRTLCEAERVRSETPK
jgi:hypothetical protein